MGILSNIQNDTISGEYISVQIVVIRNAPYHFLILRSTTRIKISLEVTWEVVFKC